MVEKELDNGLLIKYLRFLVDLAAKLLEEGMIEFEYENAIKEYEVFLERLIKSKRIDRRIKNEIVELNLVRKGDEIVKGNDFTDAIMSKLPFGGFAKNIQKEIRIQNLQKMQKSLTNVLSKLENAEN